MAAVGTEQGAGPAEGPLWVVKPDRRRTLRLAILWASGALAALLAIPAALLFVDRPVLGLPRSAWMHLFSLALLAGLGPYGFLVASEARRVRLLEQRLPDFLRDVASSHQGGMTLPSAVAVAARGEYGPLSAEVRRMADQMSWNVSFEEALGRFADRVDTPLVRRATNLILQANRSGGSTTEVLMAAARDAREIKTLETERRLGMSLYAVVIYVTFFVFLGVAAVMYAQFVPQLVASNEAVAAQAQQFQGVPGLGSSGSIRLEDFQLFYFMAAIMQGIGDGIVAGLMSTGRAVLGLRHSFVMVLIAYLTFAVFL